MRATASLASPGTPLADTIHAAGSANAPAAGTTIVSVTVPVAGAYEVRALCGNASVLAGGRTDLHLFQGAADLGALVSGPNDGAVPETLLRQVTCAAGDVLAVKNTTVQTVGLQASVSATRVAPPW